MTTDKVRVDLRQLAERPSASATTVRRRPRRARKGGRSAAHLSWGAQRQTRQLIPTKVSVALSKVSATADNRLGARAGGEA